MRYLSVRFSTILQISERIEPLKHFGKLVFSFESVQLLHVLNEIISLLFVLEFYLPFH